MRALSFQRNRSAWTVRSLFEPLSPVWLTLLIADKEFYFRERGKKNVNINIHNIFLLYVLIILSDSGPVLKRQIRTLAELINLRY